MNESLILRPQPGAQERFLSTPADIAVYGGAAGAGKSLALLLEPIRHIHVPGFGGVLFRRESKELTMEGGLVSKALNMYPYLGGVYRSQPTPSFTFPSGAKISFGHLNQEREVLAWQGSEICYLAFDEANHFCITPDHEVLTRDGWKNITEVSIGDKVFSLGVDGDSCFIENTNVVSFDYDGELIKWDKQKGISTMVTPNHRMLVTSNNVRDRWKFTEASNVENNTSYSVFRVGSKLEQQGDEYVLFDPVSGRGIGTNQNSAESISMLDWAELMGWYLSEGCSFESESASARVNIRQIKSNESLAELMNRLPWRVSSDSSCGYNIYSRQLFSKLKPMGSLYEKRIPRLFFKQSSEVIIRLLNAFAMGDGHIGSGKNSKGVSYGLANEGLIDDLQELYSLIGRVSVKSGPVVIRKEDNEYTHWRLYVSSENRQITHLKADGCRVKYKGKVWCLSVPGTHNFFVRRNGRCYFTGNSDYQINYMLSRNRSTCGVAPYIRLSVNPDADSWIAEFLKWWIDQETGYPIKERGGVIRYLIRVDGQRIWGDSREELVEQYGCELMDAKSVTFIPATITDNPILLSKDPGYLANLKGLSFVERSRLLDGNWKIRPASGMYFPRYDTTIIDWVPTDVIKWVRSWDLAASEEQEGKNVDWTVGMKVGRRSNGKLVIADVVRVQRKAAEVRALVRRIADMDGRETWIALPQDPGQSGKFQVNDYKEMLNGFVVLSRTITKNKLVMAEPAAALWQQGNIEIVRAKWNEDLLSELESFPTPRVHDDQVDCLSAAVTRLPGHSVPDYSKSGLSAKFKEFRKRHKE